MLNRSAFIQFVDGNNKEPIITFNGEIDSDAHTFVSHQ